MKSSQTKHNSDLLAINGLLRRLIQVAFQGSVSLHFGQGRIGHVHIEEFVTPEELGEGKRVNAEKD